MGRTLQVLIVEDSPDDALLLVRELQDGLILRARRKAEQDLRDSEERLRAIMESATDAIVTVDGDGRVVFANPAAERIFRLSRSDLLGLPFPTLLVERPEEAGAET